MMDDDVLPDDVVGPPVVEVAFEGPRAQRRVTVFFRWILAIPHFVYVILLSIAAYFALIIAWFAALVLGRVPEGLHGFLSGVIGYTTRVYGYGSYLLTDRYPAFDLHHDDDAIAVDIRPPGRLNRAAVLFRLILVIPVAIAATVVALGAAIALFFIWIIVLVRGSMPPSVFGALAATLRYQTRFYSYYALLTSEYPRGLFGDEVRGEPEPEPAPAPVPLDATAVPMGQPFDAPAPSLEGRIAGAPPRITRLVLSKAAKRLVVVFIVLGVLSYAASFVLSAVASTEGDRVADNLEAAHRELEAAVDVYTTATVSCAVTPNGVQCVQEANRDLAQAFAVFLTALEAESYPNTALSLAEDLQDDTQAIIDVLGQMAATSDPVAYQALATQFANAGRSFDVNYSDLIFTLRTGF